MNCQEYDALIGDAADGTLTGSALERLADHAAGCARCRTLAADFTAIRTAARTLEPQVPPPHVWTKISAAVDARRTRPFWGSFAWQSVAAATVMVLLTTALTWVGGRLTVGVAAPGRLATTAAPGGLSAAPVPTAYTDAEAHLATAIAGLEEAAQAESSMLDEETAGILRANLTVIDNAIGESRTALATQPESNVAQESLFEALRSKVALLQDTLALINEMRKGNQEGAARIASGLNP